MCADTTIIETSEADRTSSPLAQQVRAILSSVLQAPLDPREDVLHAVGAVAQAVPQGRAVVELEAHAREAVWHCDASREAADEYEAHARSLDAQGQHTHAAGCRMAALVHRLAAEVEGHRRALGLAPWGAP